MLRADKDSAEHDSGKQMVWMKADGHVDVPQVVLRRADDLQALAVARPPGLRHGDPLLAGEMVHADQGGRCASHNEIIATLPGAISGARVISSAGLPTDDKLHFNSEGSREFGKRYAAAMLSLLEPRISSAE